MFYCVAAILTYMQYDKRLDLISFWFVLLWDCYLLQLLSLVAFVWHGVIKASYLHWHFFVAVGTFSLIGAILIFIGVGQEAKKNNSDIDPEYNQAQAITARILFALSGLFHCIGCGLYGTGYSISESEHQKKLTTCNYNWKSFLNLCALHASLI